SARAVYISASTNNLPACRPKRCLDQKATSSLSRPIAPNRSRRFCHAGIEYLHSWSGIIGGMCRAGFVVEDLVEPNGHANALAEAGTWERRCAFLPPYAKIKARRVGASSPVLVAR